MLANVKCVIELALQFLNYSINSVKLVELLKFSLHDVNIGENANLKYDDDATAHGYTGTREDYTENVYLNAHRTP